MATPNGLNPHFYGLTLEAITLTPDDSASSINSIPPSVRVVSVGANANDVNDFLVLPSLADVPVGHEITIYGNPAGFEVRTPADSDEEINSENCDGTKEYAFASGSQVHIFRRLGKTTGWMAQGFTAIGAVVTAVVPD